MRRLKVLNVVMTMLILSSLCSIPTYAASIPDNLPEMPVPLESASAADFIGTWINIDLETGGCIGFIITENGGDYSFHGYGACNPTPCDWGVTPLTLYSTSISDPDDVAGTAFYDHGFAEYRIFLLLVHPQVIVALMFTKFTDGSGRHNYYSMDYFYKIS